MMVCQVHFGHLGLRNWPGVDGATIFTRSAIMERCELVLLGRGEPPLAEELTTQINVLTGTPHVDGPKFWVHAKRIFFLSSHSDYDFRTAQTTVGCPPLSF